MKALPVQVTFHRGDDGQISSLTHHQNGAEIQATRVDAQIAKSAEEHLMARIRDKTPFPNSESIIHRVVAEHVRGQPDYDGMAPPLAALAKQQNEQIRAELARAGDVNEIAYTAVSQAGWDVYEVQFANISMEWSFFLGADSKLHGLFFRPTP